MSFENKGCRYILALEDVISAKLLSHSPKRPNSKVCLRPSPLHVYTKPSLTRTARAHRIVVLMASNYILHFWRVAQAIDRLVGPVHRKYCRDEPLQYGPHQPEASSHTIRSSKLYGCSTLLVYVSDNVNISHKCAIWRTIADISTTDLRQMDSDVIGGSQLHILTSRIFLILTR